MTGFSGLFFGRRVLVTGHTGFKGAWLLLWLKKLGATLAGYSLAPATTPNLFSILNLERDIHHYVGDIRDTDRLTRVMQEFAPEMVFHLAAQALVRPSYVTPTKTFSTNVMGTVSVFEAIRCTSSVKVVVNVTSDKCYDNRNQEAGYVETDALGGYDPYSASKACSELVSDCYRHSFFAERGVALATTRAGNVIGGGDFAEDRLLPDCIRALGRHEEIVLRNPLSTRPWQYVLEPLSGYLWLSANMMMSPGQFAEAWNFGPMEMSAMTVEELVKMVLERRPGAYRVESEGHPHEMARLQLDISKASQQLRWQPVLSIDEALTSTLDWIDHFDARDNMTVVSEDHLDQYVHLAKERGLVWAK